MNIPKITFCIPSNNNLRYLKSCIQSIRENSFRKDHNIIIFVDTDNDGTIDWLSNNQETYHYQFFVNPDLNVSKFGIAKAYDFCIDKSTTDIFMIFHADMVLGVNADYHALKYLKEKTVVSATRIEPPLFPSAGEKIIQDFGLWPEDFKSNLFDQFVNEQIDSNTNKTTDGIFAPWMMYKKDFLDIGGHDHSLQSFKEDSDIFNRMVLNKYELIQSWDSLVYHFCGRGGRFEDGNLSANPSKIKEEQVSEKKFIRKWGSPVRSTPLLKPIISPKYDIGVIVDNMSYAEIEAIEPWCSHIYFSATDKENITKLIDQEQEKNKIDISSRFTELSTDANIDALGNDIIIFSEDNIFKDLSIVQEANFIVSQINQIGTFKIENMIFVIRKIQNTLIKHDQE
jgi:glycosyltransferase involved in cell wall biosynthesis